MTAPEEDRVTVDIVALRKAYDAAVAAGADEFEFGGSPWVTNYAKYILEYLAIPDDDPRAADRFGRLLDDQPVDLEKVGDTIERLQSELAEADAKLQEQLKDLGL